MRQLVVALSLSVWATYSLAQSWEWVSTDNDDTAYYIDTDSMRVVDGGVTSAWLMTVYKKPKTMGSAKGVKEVLWLNDFMCGSRSYTSRDYVMRNAKGNVITSGKDFTQYAVVPGSIGSTLYDRVCPSS